MPSFGEFPLWANLLVFGIACAVVWLAGVRLARWAGALSTATGVGEAILGIILLGGITSLPEVAVSVTGAMRGDIALSVNNLLGGLAFQVTILAVADVFVGRDALTSVNAQPAVLLQGTLDCLMLTVVALAIAVGDVALPIGAGAWSSSLLPLYVVGVVLMARARGHRAWRPARTPHSEPREHREESNGEEKSLSVRALVLRISIAAGVVLVAGAAATLSAEGIAEQTGLGASFVGVALLAAATSLPELSTAIEAVRLRRYSMAFGDVFGTNLVDVVLILLVDLVASGPPVINTLGDFSLVAALLGVLLTMIYVVGLIERRDRVVLRMGVDSVAVVLVYAGGLYLLYQLR